MGDDGADVVAKLSYYMLVAPVKLLWKSGVVPAVEHAHERSADAESDRRSAAMEPARQAREADRARQIAALKAAVPTAPLERMRATIQINGVKRPVFDHVRTHHLIGEDTVRWEETGEEIKFAVDLILELTETERAIIKQYGLDGIALDDRPAWSEQQLAQMRAEDDEEVEATKAPLLKEVSRQSRELARAMAKREREKTFVTNLLASPFTRIFDTPHEAKQYADKLKTQLLPALRKLIDDHAASKQSETLEF
jgi:hypothetical protein